MGIVRQYCARWYDWFSPGDVQVALNLPNLKTMTIKIMPDAFFEVTRMGKIPWEHELNEKDFESIEEVRLITKLRGLADFRIERYSCEFVDTEAKRQVWRGNVDRLRDYIKPIVTKPKTGLREPVRSNATPLYRGSRVTYNGSTLLPESEHRDFVGEYRLVNGQFEKSESRPTTPDEVAAQLGKTGAELWEYIVSLERISNVAIKGQMQRDSSITSDVS